MVISDRTTKVPFEADDYNVVEDYQEWIAEDPVSTELPSTPITGPFLKISTSLVGESFVVSKFLFSGSAVKGSWMHDLLSLCCCCLFLSLVTQL